MKHLYALITAIGIEFSGTASNREHDMNHQLCWTRTISADDLGCDADTYGDYADRNGDVPNGT